MDAFSRLLASIGQSLGKGLGQVGQTELEQRQRLEALETQRRAQISSQLLQTFTQLLNTQGIQEVDPEGIKAIQQAVTDLALGKVDSPNVQMAISVFPKVADSANKISVYRELATKDIDALSRLIVNTNPEEAQKLLKAVGLQGMYEGLRSRGEILAEADKLGLQLTREQIENLAAQRKALLAKLEPEIERLKAETALTNEQANALRQRLPLELTNLQLQAQRLGIDIAKGEKELARLDELLDLNLRRLATEIGLTEEQTNLLREKIKTEIVERAKTEAETRRIEADTEVAKAQAELIRRQTDLTAEQIKSLAQDRGIKLTESALNWLKDITKFAIETSADTPEKVKELLQGLGSFYSFPSDFIDSAANRIATAVREANVDRELQRTGALANAIGLVMDRAMAAESPEAARRIAEVLLPPSVSPELKTLVGNMAYYLKTLGLGKDIATIIEPYMKMLPQTPEDESRLLRELYDSLIRVKGDTPESRRIANGVVSTIKGQWALTRATQSLEQEGKKAGIDKDKALTSLYKVQAALAPKQFGLEEQKLAFEREQFSFEKWYKTEQVKLGWARLELDKLIAQAQAAGAGEDTIKALKDLANTAKALDDVAVGLLATALRKAGHASCADSLGKSGTVNWLEAVRGTDTECDNAVREILTNREKYGGVISAVENAVRFGQMVTEMASQFVGGKPAQPGGAPSGSTAPQPKDLTTGLRSKATELKQVGVSVPNDPKTAGAMTFIYALEGGPRENPFQIIPASGVTPTGPDKGFSAAVKADPMRAKAMAIDSAPALGVSWFLPILARNPGVKMRLLDPKIVEDNKPLFDKARYFGDDGVAVAAAYTAGALERAGFPIKYTETFTTLMRLLAQNDLDVLRMRNPLPPEKARERYLNLIRSRYGNKDEILRAAADLYDATRLSTIGRLAIGGAR